MARGRKAHQSERQRVGGRPAERANPATSLLAKLLDPSLLSDEQRSRWARKILALGLAAGVLLSLPLWLSARGFPLVPRLSFVPALPPPFDRAAVAVLLALALGLAIRPRPRLEVPALAAVTTLLILIDHTRCQPWVYQYVVMLLVLGPASREEPSPGTVARLGALRVMLAAIYFWSGLQKINLVFFGDTAPWLLEPVVGRLPGALQPLVAASRFVLPAVESFIGIGLLVVRLRRVALFLGLAMHVFILYAIGPFGHDVNTTVWPWNAVMMSLLWLLFGTPAPVAFRTLWSARPALLRRAAIVAFAVLPAASFVGLWDLYLSWALYSGLSLEADVYLDDRALACLPEHVRRRVVREEDGNVLHTWQWALDVLHAPPYPERWFYRRLRDQLCVCDPEGTLIVFELWVPPRWRPLTPEDHRCRDTW